jgi:predicted Zn-dependent protease
VSPRPYRWLYVQYAYTAVTLDDRGSRRAAAAALLTLWPDDPKALGIAGACLLTLDPEQAERVLQRAFDSGTADVLTPINLAMARLLLGRREQAVELLAATFDDPRLDDARRQRILEVLQQAKAADVATACAERWLLRAPTHPTPRRQLARAKARGGDAEAAVAILRQCAADEPGAVEVRQDLAFALLQTGDVEAARGLLAALVVEQPDHAWVHSLLLDVCRAAGDDAGALAEHERWARRAAADGAAWREFARALLAGEVQDLLPQALEAAERADYLAGGRDPEALRLRAETLARLGSTAEAARLRARAEALAGSR